MLRNLTCKIFTALSGLLLSLVIMGNWNPLMAAELSAPLKVIPQYGTAALAPGAAVTVNVLVTIEAPEIKPATKRPPVAVSLVIDRSGSMEEAKKLEYAKSAGKTLVKGLSPEDSFALTVYDDGVQVLSPLAPVTDKDKLLRIINGISPGGATFLSGGLEKGIEQLKSVRKEGPCRVILLSDGLANRGVVNNELVAAIGAKARNSGVSVSTIGLGLDFNEDLMQFLAQRGGGQYYYIKDSEDLPAVFKQELNLVAASFTKNLRAAFTPSEGVEDVKVYGYSGNKTGKTADIEMSDLSSGEKRQIMLRFKVTPSSAPGNRQLGMLKLDYIDQIDGESKIIDLPVAIEVIADESARKDASARHEASIKLVNEEVLLLDAEEAHVAAVAELEKGNVKEAKAIMREQQSSLAMAAPANKAVASKMEQMAQDEKNMDAASRDTDMLKSMSKSSKASAYMSAKGQTQGLMLKRGDTGFMVEKLQNALKAKGLYSKDVDGVYSPDVEAAVKQFQKSQSINADGVAGPETMRALGVQ